MASGTVVSRITGLFRALPCWSPPSATRASTPTSSTSPTRFPNSLYILVAGGVFNAVLVPQLVRAIKSRPRRRRRLRQPHHHAGRSRARRASPRSWWSSRRLMLRLLAPGYFTNPHLAAEQALAGRLRPTLPAADLLLRDVRADRPDPQRPRPVRADDVGADRQQPHLDRGAGGVPGGLRSTGHLRAATRTAPGAAARHRFDHRHRRADAAPACRTCAGRASGSARGSTSGAPVSGTPCGSPSGPSPSSSSTRSRSTCMVRPATDATASRPGRGRLHRLLECLPAHPGPALDRDGLARDGHHPAGLPAGGRWPDAARWPRRCRAACALCCAVIVPFAVGAARSSARLSRR